MDLPLEGFCYVLSRPRRRQSARVAAVESRTSMDELRALPSAWKKLLPGRKSPVAEPIIDALLDEPVMSADEIVAASGSPTAAAYNAIDRLTDVGVITEITGRRRDRVWAATDALGEWEELDRRIQTRSTREFSTRARYAAAAAIRPRAAGHAASWV